MADLNQAAQAVSQKAYAKYSQFQVGAALRTKSGAIFTGCNVENISFGLTVCAERNAIGAMIAAGESAPEEIVVYTPTDKPTLPCGACRQVLLEFNPQIKVRSVCQSGALFQGTLADLLPHAFNDLNS